ncbi:MAG: HIT family protein [Methanoregula sp.]|nr:HIT family protein [Methanoregula sp.]
MDKTPVTCPFCNPAADEMVAKNVFCYARWDRYPVSKGHLLVIPFRHVADYFSLTVEVKHAVFAPVDECKEVIEENLSPAVYNIGFNFGEAAGQTVMHCHYHVIPRYVGDVRDARGVVRGLYRGRGVLTTKVRKKLKTSMM